MSKELSGDFDPDSFGTLGEFFESTCAKYRNKTAYSCFGSSITYGELDELSQRFSAWLRDHSELKPGDRIALQLPNILQFPVAFWGAIKAGLLVVNTNPLYTPREMKHQFQDSGVKAIVILENFAHNLQTILPETEISTVITTQAGDLLPWPKGFIVSAGAKYLKKLVPAFDLPDAVSFKKVLEQTPTYVNDKFLDSGTDTAILLYTGGTTGLAKGAMLTHRNLISNMMQLRTVSKTLILDGEGIIVAPLPLYHTYAFMFHVLAMAHAGNHNVLIPNPRDLDSLVKTLRGIRMNGFVGINTLYLALARHKDISKIDFSGMRFSGAGGMALTRKVAEEWARISNCEIYEGYGLTECSPIVTINPPDKVKIGSVGVPLPQTELKLVNDEGEEQRQDELNSDGMSGQGELWIRGPQVMEGYWRNEDATREALTDDGWFKSGDYAQIDRDGYVFIVDRKKDMINVSGFNVFPSEIEELINGHPDVLESAAIGVPDERSGESVKLFVVKQSPDLEKDAVQAFCRENLTPYKVPREIVFVDELPKSNIGKILRRELREND